MEFKRTPDERFDNLVDYPFKPHYLQVDDAEGGQLRIHYLDEGPADGDVVLLLHGQPAWSYLYRHMIPPLVEAGFRVIAPDLVGFGRSDKPTRIEDYTYARHVAWMSDWLTQLDLSGITVFLQDWGSLIGLRLVAAFPERFAGVVLANGGLPAGPIPEEFAAPEGGLQDPAGREGSGTGSALSRTTSGHTGLPVLAQVLRRKPGIQRPGTVIACWQCRRLPRQRKRPSMRLIPMSPTWRARGAFPRWSRCSTTSRKWRKTRPPGRCSSSSISPLCVPLPMTTR